MSPYKSVASREYDRKARIERPGLPDLQVAVRVKPSVETGCGDSSSCVTTYDNESVRIGSRVKSPVFTFDRVFHGDGDTEEDEFFYNITEPIIEDCCDSSNANTTVLLYGELGTGKIDCLISASNGLIPRSLIRIFRLLSFKKAKEQRESDYECQVSLQVVELLNKEIFDLLKDSSFGRRVGPKESSKTLDTDHAKPLLHIVGSDSTYLSGIFTKTVRDVDDAMHCLERCLKRRQSDSLSHTVMTVCIHQSCGDTKLLSKVNFVDLAAPQHPEVLCTRSNEFREQCNVNNSLMVLGIVLSVLWVESRHRGDEKRPLSFVPYRDSLLTSVLKGSLGGNSKVLLIACIASALRESEKNLDVLRFAYRLKNLKTKLSIAGRAIRDASFDEILSTNEHESHDGVSTVATDKTKRSKAITRLAANSPHPVGTRMELAAKSKPESSLKISSAQSTNLATVSRQSQRASTEFASRAQTKKRILITSRNKGVPVAPTNMITRNQPVGQAIVAANPRMPSVKSKQPLRKVFKNSIPEKLTNKHKKPESDPDPSDMSDLLDALLDPAEKMDCGTNLVNDMSGMLDALLDPSEQSSPMKQTVDSKSIAGDPGRQLININDEIDVAQGEVAIIPNPIGLNLNQSKESFDGLNSVISISPSNDTSLQALSIESCKTEAVSCFQSDTSNDAKGVKPAKEQLPDVRSGTQYGNAEQLLLEAHDFTVNETIEFQDQDLCEDQEADDLLNELLENSHGLNASDSDNARKEMQQDSSALLPEELLSESIGLAVETIDLKKALTTGSDENFGTVSSPVSEAEFTESASEANLPETYNETENLSAACMVPCSSYLPQSIATAAESGRHGIFHIGDIIDPGLDTKLSRKNMLLTRQSLRKAVENSNKAIQAKSKPVVIDIPPLPMNNEDLTRMLNVSGLILNEYGDFALPSSKFSSNELEGLSVEDQALHESNSLYRLIGFWECRWKIPEERKIIRDAFLKIYTYEGQDPLDSIKNDIMEESLKVQDDEHGTKEQVHVSQDQKLQELTAVQVGNETEIRLLSEIDEGGQEKEGILSDSASKHAPRAISLAKGISGEPKPQWEFQEGDTFPKTREVETSMPSLDSSKVFDLKTDINDASWQMALPVANETETCLLSEIERVCEGKEGIRSDVASDQPPGAFSLDKGISGEQKSQSEFQGRDNFPRTNETRKVQTSMPSLESLQVDDLKTDDNDASELLSSVNDWRVSPNEPEPTTISVTEEEMANVVPQLARAENNDPTIDGICGVRDKMLVHDGESAIHVNLGILPRNKMTVVKGQSETLTNEVIKDDMPALSKTRNKLGGFFKGIRNKLKSSKDEKTDDEVSYAQSDHGNQ